MRTLVRFSSTRGGAALIGAVAAVLVTLPVMAFASHQFSDVPDTHPFHGEISAVNGAGITTGFADGTFRPGNTVTRQAMAAFFERGGSRAARGANFQAGDAGQTIEVAQVTMEAGATQSGGGFVQLVGSVSAFTAGANTATCPCIVDIRIVEPNGVTIAGPSLVHLSGQPSNDMVAGSTALAGLTVLAADAVRTYRLVAAIVDANATNISVSGSLSATYVPFSGDGDNTLDRTERCPLDDGFEQNDTPSNAIPVFVDGGRSLPAIACPGDLDRYRSNRGLATGDRILATVNFVHTEGDIDACLYLGSTQLSCSTSKTNSESFDHVVTTAGFYHVEVFLAEDSGAVPGNPYLLLYRTIPASNVTDDPGHDPAEPVYPWEQP